MNKLTRVALCAVLLTGFGATPVAEAALIFESGFNFRSTRYNKPLRFNGDPDIIVFGGTITDPATGLPPADVTAFVTDAQFLTAGSSPGP